MFKILSSITKFEDITKGRQGAIIIDSHNNTIPIVRTTTIYKNENQPFLRIHRNMIDIIKKITKLPLEFNNAMVEIYTQEYKTMGYHSDQALDLADDSYICIFSCYDEPACNVRKLQIKNKITNECSEVSLDNNSIVLFSTSTNKQHLHRIVLEGECSDWLGITFRLSKTYIEYINKVPYFCSNKLELLAATSEEKKEFYKLRSKENKEVNFVYPEINYTIGSI